MDHSANNINSTDTKLDRVQGDCSHRSPSDVTKPCEVHKAENSPHSADDSLAQTGDRTRTVSWRYATIPTHMQAGTLIIGGDFVSRRPQTVGPPPEDRGT